LGDAIPAACLPGYTRKGLVYMRSHLQANVRKKLLIYREIQVVTLAYQLPHKAGKRNWLHSRIEQVSK
jgi:hypothetical protein